ncbi:hypothetical protein SUDANB178_01512 [Streptomyces sp. enrichment culture]
MTTASESRHGWEPALSVRRVLTLERVPAGEPEVVAGADRLDRPVRRVHVAEAADAGVMLSGGEMVLTTGVLQAGDEAGQAGYVRSPHRAEAAAVLGLGRASPEWQASAVIRAVSPVRAVSERPTVADLCRAGRDRTSSVGPAARSWPPTPPTATRPHTGGVPGADGALIRAE